MWHSWMGTMIFVWAKAEGLSVRGMRSITFARVKADGFGSLSINAGGNGSKFSAVFGDSFRFPPRVQEKEPLISAQ